MTHPRIAVLVSGGGRSLENLAELQAKGELPIELALVCADRDGCGALARADRLGLPSLVVPWDRNRGLEAFSADIFQAIEAARADFVVLAGFLRLLRIPPAWEGRVINIHPSLLPAFGGKGYYGDRVHAAVLERGVQFTGCTVHLVDNDYDNGRILLQRVIPVRPDDTVESLGARVFEEEKKALPQALTGMIQGR